MNVTNKSLLTAVKGEVGRRERAPDYITVVLHQIPGGTFLLRRPCKMGIGPADSVVIWKRVLPGRSHSKKALALVIDSQMSFGLGTSSRF